MGQAYAACCTTADTAQDKKLELAPAFQSSANDVSSEIYML